MRLAVVEGGKDEGGAVVLRFGMHDDPVLAAGAIYRELRSGRDVTALAPPAHADAIGDACERIGLPRDLCRPDPGAVRRNGDGAALQPLRIAIAGYGVVGQALAQRIADEPGIEIVSILARDPSRSRPVPPPCPIVTDAKALFAASPDVLVDVLSCDRLGAELTEAALADGAHVASASKRVVSAHHARLAALATESGAAFLYSAAVGGGAPVIETIDRARSLGEVASFAGTLNGTVNYILHRMASGLPFAAALKEAQNAGFAEEDSEADLSGADAAAKLRIAALHAFGVAPESVSVALDRLDDDAIARIEASGTRWVQVARLERAGDRITASVRLQPIAEVGGLEAGPAEWNSACVTLTDGRHVRCGGRGAGGAPTAEAIVADLHDIAARRSGSDAAGGEKQAC